MARSEFRYNLKRKHYTYVFGEKRIVKNNKLTIIYKFLLLTSKSKRKKKKNGKYKEYDNVKLYQHPNPNKTVNQYVIPKVKYDDENSFAEKKSKWAFHPYDRRKIKKIKKGKWKK